VSKRKILLADDSVTIQKVVNLTFADEDIEITTVSDGDAAMKKFVEAVPDLVMVDVNMPGLDGYRICEMIKQDAETRHIPVILLVGSFEPFDEAEMQRVGANDFLTKPFQSISQLVNKVSDLLGEKTAEKGFLPPVEDNSAPLIDDLYDLPKTEAAGEFDSADNSIEHLGDAGIDDEMIQTSQFDASSAAEKVKEYESEPVVESELINESFPKEINPTSLKPPYSFDRSTVKSETEKDWAKTQPLSKEDIKEIEAVSGAAIERKTAPASNFDESDLPESSQPAQKAVDDRVVLPTDSKIYNETANKNDEAKTEIPERHVENPEIAGHTAGVSLELVEAIADRVVEKMSGKLIEKIVREVFAQMEEKK